MRIAFITFEYPPRLWGGAGVYAKNIVSNLAELGHGVNVYVPNPKGTTVVERDEAGVEVHRMGTSVDWLPAFPAFCLNVTRRLEKAEGRERPEVVHINSMSFFAFRDRSKGPAYVSTGHHMSAETARKVDVGTVDRLMDYRGESGYLSSMMERYGARFPDRYIAVSHETRRSLQSLYHVPEQRIDVIWNGVDIEAAPTGMQDREEIKARLGLPSCPILLFVGRVDDPRKDLLTIVRALALVPRSLGVCLAVVGKGNTTKAETLAKQLGVRDRVLFRGYVGPEELWGTYLAADAHICASRQEGFGITILEALSAGCKVISTEVGVVPELKGRIEAVVPMASPESMARAITDMLGHPGKSCIVEVKVPYEFSWARSAKQTLAVYEKALEDKRSSRK